MNNDKNRAGILKVGELFGQSLSIPSYQRPYSWDDEQVIQLMDDLIEAWEKKKKAYLVGNIIIHEKDNKWNLVDGQQRVITFSLLLYALDVSSCNLRRFLDDKTHSPLSIPRMNKNYHLIKARISRIKHFNKSVDSVTFEKYIKKQTVVTYTLTRTIDEAFFYFDSQNTRGRPLVRKDLLKVHHLREMFGKEKKSDMRKIAKGWEEKERIDEDEPYLGKENDFLEFLFDQLLGVARKSVRGELVAEELIKLDVYKEFRSEGGIKRLNNYNQPPLFDRYDYDIDNDSIRYLPKFAPFEGPYMLRNGIDYLPFELTQSIDGGKNFFLYAFKYSKHLIGLRKQHPIFTLLDNVGGAGNGYLRKIYRASLLYYYDKFGDELFEKFAIYLFVLLAYYRANSGSIYVNGVMKFRWNGEDELNPFKIIMLKYSPDHVLNTLHKYIDYYCNDTISQGWYTNLKGTRKSFYNGIDVHFKKQRDKVIEGLWGNVS